MNAPDLPAVNQHENNSAAVETEQDPMGDNNSHRFPDWLPEDMRHLKGPAVGPTDSMLDRRQETQELPNAQLVESPASAYLVYPVQENNGANEASLLRKCIPDTSTNSGKLLCLGIVFAIASVVTVVSVAAIVCTSGACTSEDDTPPMIFGQRSVEDLAWNVALMFTVAHDHRGFRRLHELTAEPKETLATPSCDNTIVD
ncbi:expressed unknown protein [Seminavis robusta]|uniref:Transmembrane protein n=1 Tax=Seminavis robusta TaxID=568900 RepID=A0A9N8EZ00_9STRA|nr:expressed unknown protein [Seminavis robusta]|eukprot:Sro2496_g329341.1  (200) ;mRNA; f:13410-14009